MTISIQRARDILQQAELLYSHEQVQAALHEVARQINTALADTHPLVLSVMGGAVVFSGQLLPLLDFPLDFDYVHVSRYGDARQGGAMHWKVAPHENVRGRVVLVLDDILDEGETLRRSSRMPCSADSTPSAMTERLNSCARPITASTIVMSCSSSSMSRTKDWSILSVSTGRCLR